MRTAIRSTLKKTNKISRRIILLLLFFAVTSVAHRYCSRWPGIDLSGVRLLLWKCLPENILQLFIK